MNSTSTIDRNTISSLVKALILVLVVLFLIFIVWALFASPGTDQASNKRATPAENTHYKSSPDRVKDSAGPNSDTAPSSNGTGVVSTNSLLGQ